MSRSQAWFNDGQTAARLAVTVEMDVNGLRIDDAAGVPLALWPYDSLRHREEPFAGQPVQLRQLGEEGRLVLEDLGFVAELTERAPQLLVVHRSRSLTLLSWAGSAALGAIMLVAVLWYALPAFASVATRLVPLSWEVALGDLSFKQVTELLARMDGQDGPQFCEDRPESLALLTGLVGRLAAEQDSPYDFRVTVINGNMVNAFALPGGRVVLMRGLFGFVESPDELAAVLAHEMGHVTHQHGTEQLIKSLGLTFFFGVMLGDLGSGAVGLAGETLLSNAFSRDAEREADQSAITTLTGAGLSSGGLGDFFRRLEQLEDGEAGDPGAFALLSTHPSHGERIALAEQAGQAGAAALSAAEWETLKAICDEG